jgi:hypothetical protein
MSTPRMIKGLLHCESSPLEPCPGVLTWSERHYAASKSRFEARLISLHARHLLPLTVLRNFADWEVLDLAWCRCMSFVSFVIYHDLLF